MSAYARYLLPQERTELREDPLAGRVERSENAHDLCGGIALHDLCLDDSRRRESEGHDGQESGGDVGELHCCVAGG